MEKKNILQFRTESEAFPLMLRFPQHNPLDHLNQCETHGPHGKYRNINSTLYGTLLFIP